MIQRPTDTIAQFRSEFLGRTLTAADSDYDQARSLWNGAIDGKPAVIARCTTPEQVAQAIRFGRHSGLEIAVRGGGHNYAGHAVCNGGLMIHLGDMNQVRVDPARRRAVCGGGATWRDLDAATQQHGLATPGGFISHTGVGGLTLGGGIGWLSKKAGLSCDNLAAVQLVTADGRVVRAAVDENPDLFWALRGGGGNFGVATSFEFMLHPAGPLIQLGVFFLALDDDRGLRFAREFVHELPEDVASALLFGAPAPAAPFVPPQYVGQSGHLLLLVGFGAPETHAAAVALVRGAVKPLFEMVAPMPYVVLQSMFDEMAAWGLHAYQKALYVDDLSDRALSVIGEYAASKPVPLAMAATFVLGGRYREIAEQDTAFGGPRGAKFLLNIEGATPSGTSYEAVRTWVRDYYDAMLPFANGTGSYVNFLQDSNDERVKATYGAEKYARLAQIKAEWDPDNVFHRNANIKPAHS